MSAFTFFWHDYETFGLDPRRDTPAQFAGVRTDAELNEIDAPVRLHCHPPLDRLPSPQSCLVTGLTPQRCRELGVPEHAFAEAVHAQLARPGTVGVGYNSLRFDDEFTRFMFWRNLIDPYAREWQDDCGRWDLMDTVRCAYALRPEGLQWPRHPDGRASFRLEDLSAANGLAHEAAHDALSDVRATLALARRLRAEQPRLWDFCLSMRKKSAVQAEMSRGKPLLHISGMYAAERGCLAVVWPFAPHPHNRNEVIVWDLAHDPTELMALDTPTLRRRLFSRKDDLPAGEERLPIKTVHLNRSPVITWRLQVLSPPQAERWGVDMARVQQHAAIAARISGEMAGVWPEVYAAASRNGPVDVDGDLYSAFLEERDRRTLQHLRSLPPEGLARTHPTFSDERLAELLFRYRARNFPHTLDAEETQRWQAHCRARLLQGKDGGPTLAQWQAELDALASGADARARAVLDALSQWAQEIAPAALEGAAGTVDEVLTA